MSNKQGELIVVRKGNYSEFNGLKLYKDIEKLIGDTTSHLANQSVKRKFEEILLEKLISKKNRVDISSNKFISVGLIWLIFRAGYFVEGDFVGEQFNYLLKNTVHFLLRQRDQ